MQPFTAFRRSVAFRVEAQAISGAHAAPVLRGAPMRAVTAVGIPALAGTPLLLIDLTTRQGRVQPQAITKLASALLPPMRHASLGVALLLAALALLWAPIVGAAVLYAGMRLAHRSYLRRTLAAEIEMHLVDQLGADWPEIRASGAMPYSEVRSLQISGNSTTSSILRR